MNETTNIITNEVIGITTSTTVYEVAQNIYTMLSVLTFIIFIMSLYKILKNNFSFRK